MLRIRKISKSIKHIVNSIIFTILVSLPVLAAEEGEATGGSGGSWTDQVKADQVPEGISPTSIVLGIVLIAFIGLAVYLRQKQGAKEGTKDKVSAKKGKATKEKADIKAGGLVIPMLKGKTNEVLGVDITNETITIAQVKRTKTGIELDKLVTAMTPQNTIRDGEIIDTVSVSQVIQDLIQSNEITAKRAIATVSGQAAIIRTIQFPSMSAGELKEVILHEAERYIPFPIGDVNIDFQTLMEVEDEGIDKQEVLLVAAQKQFINSYVETFSIAGLKLIAVDVASFAVARSLTIDKSSLGAGEAVILLIIRSETTDITVFRNGIPRFSRSIPIGSTTFIETIASNLNISLEEAMHTFDNVVIPIAGQGVSEDPTIEMASNEIKSTLRELTGEIQRSLEYYQSQETHELVQQIILSGRGTKMKNLDKHLSMALGLDVEIGNPLNYIQFDTANFDSNYLIENAPILATAIGLAKRGIQGF